MRPAQFMGIRWARVAASLVLLLWFGCEPARNGSPTPAQPGSRPPTSIPVAQAIDLLNVSYDPTRELYQELNGLLIQRQQAAGRAVVVRQSHGGSSSQARAVIDGLEADVVTLALWSDINAIRERGLIAPGWEDRFPNCSSPFTSTIEFLVRKGNPKGIRDWPDLVGSGVQIITPNPKTGGGAKLSFLAAWGSVINRGGSPEEAREFVTQIYRHVPVLDSGARAATNTFAQKGIGDVYLCWENEGHMARQERLGELEFVYPPSSLRAEPSVALVDANVDLRRTRDMAAADLDFLYTPAAQAVIAQRFYRPTDPHALQENAERFPRITLFEIPAWAATGPRRCRTSFLMVASTIPSPRPPASIDRPHLSPFSRSTGKCQTICCSAV